jgi:hypothetical protein
MNFRLRTVFLFVWVFGIVLHLFECFRSGSFANVGNIGLVFIAGSFSFVFLATLAVALIGRLGIWVGAFVGLSLWLSMLYWLVIFDGESFRFVWVHVVLMTFFAWQIIRIQNEFENRELSSKNSVSALLNWRNDKRD